MKHLLNIHSGEVFFFSWNHFQHCNQIWMQNFASTTFTRMLLSFQFNVMIESRPYFSYSISFILYFESVNSFHAKCLLIKCKDLCYKFVMLIASQNNRPILLRRKPNLSFFWWKRRRLSSFLRKKIPKVGNKLDLCNFIAFVVRKGDWWNLHSSSSE